MCVTAKPSQFKEASKQQGPHPTRLCLLGPGRKEPADALSRRRRLGRLLAATAPATALALAAGRCCRWRLRAHLELLPAVPHRLSRRGSASAHKTLLPSLLRLACGYMLLVGDWLHGLPLLLLPAGKRRGGLFPAAGRLLCCHRLGFNARLRRDVTAAMLLLQSRLAAAKSIIPGCYQRAAVWQRPAGRLSCKRVVLPRRRRRRRSRWRRRPPDALLLRLVRWLVQLHYIRHIYAPLLLPLLLRLLLRQQRRCSSLGGPQSVLPRCWRHPRSPLPAAGNAGWLLELLSMLRLLLLLPRLLLLGHAAPLGAASSGRSSGWGRVRLHGVRMQSACRHGRADGATRWSTAGNATAQQAGTPQHQRSPLCASGLTISDAPCSVWRQLSAQVSQVKALLSCCWPLPLLPLLLLMPAWPRRRHRRQPSTAPARGVSAEHCNTGQGRQAGRQISGQGGTNEPGQQQGQ